MHPYLSQEGLEMTSNKVFQYKLFVEASAQGRGQLTKLFILPDFTSNSDYDLFMGQMICRMADELNNKNGFKTVRSALRKRGINDQTIDHWLRTSDETRRIAIANTLEGCFRPVYFYGRDISETDIIDISEERGPRERAQVLMRGPYYMAQMVNSLRVLELVHEDMNRQLLYCKNTEYALRQDLTGHNRYIDSFRSS